MARIEYTEYDPAYAKAVAAMWNRSSDGWNGRVWNSSETKVLQEERDSVYLKLWLALSGAEVIGYAKLTKYSLEEGVAYVELISVDPAWHGQGVGKALMQKCVERSVELGYQRLDLFTWAGNTKAVPLYKKCGFFWERMEAQATHLMNFLPGILNNPFFRPYFDHFHWYDDLERDLAIAPDGREANGFEFYDYLWSKGGRELAISFEKTGRGIASFSTDRISVECVVGQARPVFGVEYPVRYLLHNRSGKPLSVRLEGRDDNYVKYSASQQLEVLEEAGWEARFSLEQPEPDSGEWQSLPGVRTLLTLGEQSLELKTGLKTQFPMSLSLTSDCSFVMPGREQNLYLNVQNHYDSACEFDLEILPQEPVKLAENRHQTSLGAQARSCIPLRFSCTRGCIWTPLLRVTARPANGQPVSFEKRGEIMLRAFESRDHKTLEQYHALINGQYTLTVGTKQGKNRASFSSVFGEYCHILDPMLGQPFSDEFEHLDPCDVSFEDLGGANQITLRYRSRDFAGAEFAIVYRLYPSGLLEYFLQVMRLAESGAHVTARLRVMPYNGFITYEHDGRLCTLTFDQPEADLEDLAEDCISGNYIFAGREGVTTSFVWDPNIRAKILDWYLAWDFDLSAMQRSGITQSEPIRMYLNLFQNAWQLRSYARGSYVPSTLVHPSLELVANLENPFVSGPFSAELIWGQDRDLAGEFSLSLNGEMLPEKKVLEPQSGLRELSWNVADLPNSPVLHLASDAALPLYRLRRCQTLFQPRGEVDVHGQGNWLSAQNGILKLGAAQDASLPVLLSLEFEGLEWLAQAYPGFEAKSHYNPFPGGLHARPEGISLANLQKEKHLLSTATVSDQHGNIWQGLAYETEIAIYKPLKGLRFRQYYLTLPGLPLLAITCEVVAGTGFAGFERLPLMGFFSPGQDIENCRLLAPISEDRWQSLDAGVQSTGLMESCRHLIVQDKNSGQKLQILNPGKAETGFHLDKSVARVRIDRFSSSVLDYPKWMAPTFMVFSPEKLDWENFGQLLETRFGTGISASGPLA